MLYLACSCSRLFESWAFAHVALSAFLHLESDIWIWVVQGLLILREEIITHLPQSTWQLNWICIGMCGIGTSRYYYIRNNWLMNIHDLCHKFCLATHLQLVSWVKYYNLLTGMLMFYQLMNYCIRDLHQAPLSSPLNGNACLSSCPWHIGFQFKRQRMRYVSSRHCK